MFLYPCTTVHQCLLLVLASVVCVMQYAHSTISSHYSFSAASHWALHWDQQWWVDHYRMCCVVCVIATGCTVSIGSFTDCVCVFSLYLCSSLLLDTIIRSVIIFAEGLFEGESHVVWVCSVCLAVYTHTHTHTTHAHAHTHTHTHTHTQSSPSLQAQ